MPCPLAKDAKRKLAVITSPETEVFSPHRHVVDSRRVSFLPSLGHWTWTRRLTKHHRAVYQPRVHFQGLFSLDRLPPLRLCSSDDPHHLVLRDRAVLLYAFRVRAHDAIHVALRDAQRPEFSEARSAEDVAAVETEAFGASDGREADLAVKLAV